MPKEIPLTRGHVAIVDDEDYADISRFKWCAHTSKRRDGTVKTVYAKRNFVDVNRKRITVLMHREIARVPKNMQVDHVDGNGLNNTRANLRACTNMENQNNQRPKRVGSSMFKGVSWLKENQKWRAQIRINGKTRHVGLYATETEAAMAYDGAAIRWLGPFAHTNFKE